MFVCSHFFLSYPPDDYRCSDDVYSTQGQGIWLPIKTTLYYKAIRITRKQCGQTSFLCILPVAVARCHALPVLQMFSYHGTYTGGRTGSGTALCILARRLPLAERMLLWVGRPASLQAVLLLRRPRTRDVARAMALQSTRGPSRHLHKQSAVMTIEAATIRYGRVAACV